MRLRTGTRKLKNPSKQLLEFLHLAKPVKIESIPGMLLTLRSQFPAAKELIVLRGDRVGGIIANGCLSMFVPWSHLTSPQVSPVGGKLKVKEVTEPMVRLADWIKTRNGYVPADGRMFLAELTKRRPGHFANLGNL